jgi:aryl-alcohol dehydrogenase-like predicted oxidoreductase
MGLGAGGHSRLGQRHGKSEAESAAVVRRALELGANLIDTAEAYGTEAIVGQALAGVPRGDFVLSTKKSPRAEGRLISAQELIAGADASLSRLGLDHIDIYHIHGVKAHEYAHVRAELVPALLQLRDQGKIRWLGITESFSEDTTHAMLAHALQDDVWDVMMVGFNLLNFSARERVLPITQRKEIGVLCMFAVRRALTDPAVANEVIQELAAAGEIDLTGYDPAAPLGFLTAPGVAASLAEAAYRYCRHEPGIHVVLSGTGSLDHLEENAQAIQGPPLPAPAHARIDQLFAGVDSVSGN